ncbi:unnamed protein product [Amoebophrya sp. A120]|nr:unnamed protein product [Amoebophrya sp. A120]|eukprot:GSA120T00005030001.1
MHHTASSPNFSSRAGGLTEQERIEGILGLQQDAFGEARMVRGVHRVRRTMSFDSMGHATHLTTPESVSKVSHASSGRSKEGRAFSRYSPPSGGFRQEPEEIVDGEDEDEITSGGKTRRRVVLPRGPADSPATKLFGAKSSPLPLGRGTAATSSTSPVFHSNATSSGEPVRLSNKDQPSAGALDDQEAVVDGFREKFSRIAHSDREPRGQDSASGDMKKQTLVPAGAAAGNAGTRGVFDAGSENAAARSLVLRQNDSYASRQGQQGPQSRAPPGEGVELLVGASAGAAASSSSTQFNALHSPTRSLQVVRETSGNVSEAGAVADQQFSESSMKAPSAGAPPLTGGIEMLGKDDQQHNSRSGRNRLNAANSGSTTRRDQQQQDEDNMSYNMAAVDTLPEAEQKFRWLKFLGELISWLLPAAVGILTAISGGLIQIVSSIVFTWRSGLCVTNIFKDAYACCGHEVNVDFKCRAKLAASGQTPHTLGTLMTWEQLATANSLPEDAAYWCGWIIWVGSAVLLSLFAALLCKFFAPAAKGSGIPEVKAILGGFNMRAVLAWNTLLVKLAGLTSGVAAGLTLGKEGPLVHVACCWAEACGKLFPWHYASSPANRRELLSAATAAGVSVAFGAPLGGVLFSFEEASTFFSQRTSTRAFFAAVSAALMLMYLNPTGTGKLTLFQVTDTWKLDPVEYIFFCLLGIIGGVIGAFFIKVNTAMLHFRESEFWRRYCPLEVEISLIAVLTVVSTLKNRFMAPLMVDVIFRLFEPCEDFVNSRSQTEFVVRSLHAADEMHLCHRDGSPKLEPVTLQELAAAGVLRFVLMCVTFGAPLPAGLFVPSLFVGGALGRLLGSYLYYIGITNQFGFGDLLSSPIAPSVYGIVGATAVLGGVCRVTISLVVIMFELTGALQHIVPFMLAAQFARWTGDLFNDGIYDRYILLKKYLFLQEPEGTFTPGYAADIVEMTPADLCIRVPSPESAPITLGMLEKLLQQWSTVGAPPTTTSASAAASFGPVSGYPLLVRRTNAATKKRYHAFIGYVHAAQLREDVADLLGPEGYGAETPVYFVENEEVMPLGSASSSSGTLVGGTLARPDEGGTTVGRTIGGTAITTAMNNYKMNNNDFDSARTSSMNHRGVVLLSSEDDEDAAASLSAVVEQHGGDEDVYSRNISRSPRGSFEPPENLNELLLLRGQPDSPSPINSRPRQPPGTIEVGATTAIDLSDLVDRTLLRIAPETPLHLAHHIFYRLGLRLVAVVDHEGAFHGLITKKRFVTHVISLNKKARRRLHHTALGMFAQPRGSQGLLFPRAAPSPTGQNLPANSFGGATNTRDMFATGDDLRRPLLDDHLGGRTPVENSQEK